MKTQPFDVWTLIKRIFKKMTTIKKLITFMNILLLTPLIPLCLCAKCPDSNSSSNTITSVYDGFTGSALVKTYGIATGSVSSSTYYMYYISFTHYFKWAIRKINFDGSLAWMAAVGYELKPKSLVVDLNEQYVYIAVFDSGLSVVKFDWSTGNIVDAK